MVLNGGGHRSLESMAIMAISEPTEIACVANLVIKVLNTVHHSGYCSERRLSVYLLNQPFTVGFICLDCQ